MTAPPANPPCVPCVPLPSFALKRIHLRQYAQSTVIPKAVNEPAQSSAGE